MELRVKFPPKLTFLPTAKSRYKVLYGGRGGAKSHSVAEALLLIGLSRKIRVLCARETQKSIADSVHKLLTDKVEKLGLGYAYEIEKATIYGRNGTEFVFAGLRHNIDNIKSYEALDYVWVEEAQNVSQHSWDTLIPTIRKEGSEIWMSFNPDLDDDPTYQFVLHPPPNSIVVKINYLDNPFCPAELIAEAEHMKATRPVDYDHIYLGNTKQVVEGAVYANELREATAGGRITSVNRDPTKPVHTFWDLGIGDSTSIWFAQSIGFEFRIIDFLEDSGKKLEYYLLALQARGYLYGTHYLPHDARAKELGTGKSIEELIRAAGHRVQIVTKLSPADGINAARTIFPQCWFDREKCADGINSLRHYQYEMDHDKGTFKREPLHNWASHAADAFRYFAVGIKQDRPKPPVKQAEPMYAGPQGWMG